MSEPPPMPPYEGFDPKYDIEIDKQTGCFIRSKGTMPEVGWWFLYHANKYHFYFSAKLLFRVDGRTFDIVVDSFSEERFGGPNPRIELADLPAITRNMERFFSERDFFSSALVRDPNTVFGTLSFKWRPQYHPWLV